MPTTDQLELRIAAEIEFPAMRSKDDPMYDDRPESQGKQYSKYKCDECGGESMDVATVTGSSICKGCYDLEQLYKK